jgi:hypothetical protein
MKVGSEAHKVLFCESFLASHRRYEPESLQLPRLDDTALARLRGVPFWDEALSTERKAGVMLAAYAAGTRDPMVREAIALQAHEEARHARLIAHMLAHYGIPYVERPLGDVPADLENAFIGFGYGECFDSFFAFGLHRIVQRAGIVPDALCDLFDPVLQEEARHIVFFVNWIAWTQIREGRGPLRGPHAWLRYAGAMKRRFGALRAGQNAGASTSGFTATGARAIGQDLSPEVFLDACIEENDKRMAGFDESLLRPRFLPATARLALKAMRIVPARHRGVESVPAAPATVEAAGSRARV